MQHKPDQQSDNNCPLCSASDGLPLYSFPVPACSIWLPTIYCLLLKSWCPKRSRDQVLPFYIICNIPPCILVYLMILITIARWIRILFLSCSSKKCVWKHGLLSLLKKWCLLVNMAKIWVQILYLCVCFLCKHKITLLTPTMVPI